MNREANPRRSVWWATVVTSIVGSALWVLLNLGSWSNFDTVGIVGEGLIFAAACAPGLVVARVSGERSGQGGARPIMAGVLLGAAGPLTAGIQLWLLANCWFTLKGGRIWTGLLVFPPMVLLGVRFALPRGDANA